jgi:hypothetical protein
MQSKWIRLLYCHPAHSIRQFVHEAQFFRLLMLLQVLRFIRYDFTFVLVTAVVFYSFS